MKFKNNKFFEFQYYFTFQCFKQNDETKKQIFNFPYKFPVTIYMSPTRSIPSTQQPSKSFIIKLQHKRGRWNEEDEGRTARSYSNNSLWFSHSVFILLVF